MKNYVDLVEKCLADGVRKEDRTGTGTLSLFGEKLDFDLKRGFPLVTVKKTSFDLVLKELLWFISGNTNIKRLNDQNCNIWNEWADENGDLGPVYGKQWRDFGGVDQLVDVVHKLRNNPDDRRMIVSAWNVPEIPAMALPPCHVLFQFYTRLHMGKRYLSCQIYQRSCDLFLGVPFNIASYATLTHIIAHACDMEVDWLHWVGGDTHLYLNHLTQAEIMCDRSPTISPILKINTDYRGIDCYELSDFELLSYHPHGAIKAPVAV